MPKLFSVALTLAMVVSFLPAQTLPAYAASTTIVISQVYGGGGNSGATFKNDFIELYNLGSATISVAGWSVQYASATGTGNFGSSATMITPLSGSIAPGKYLLIQEAQGSGGTTNLPFPDISDSTPLNMSGSDGKIALVNTTAPLGCNGGSNPCSVSALATIVDLVGYGTANFFEGSGAAPQLSNTTAGFRNGGGSIDTDNNAADFTAGAPNPRNSAFPFAATGLASPETVIAGQTTKLTVTVTPVTTDPASTGITVWCNLNSYGGSNHQTLFDDGTNGDLSSGDKIFSFDFTPTVPQSGNLTCTFADAQGRSSTVLITLNRITIIPIGTVNGAVGNSENGATRSAAYADKVVEIRGVIYETTLQAISGSTDTYKGFFIQNTSATKDALVNSSDGLFVFMNINGTMTTNSGGFYTPTIGDEIVIYGKISEFNNMTEMVNPTQVGSVLRSGVNLNSELPPAVANPPADLADANRYWERLQGMRVQVPQNSIVLGGRNVFSPADAEIWLARSDSTIALRVDPFTRRAFRDANPLDDNYNAASWDGNGYRILMGSLGIKGTADDAQVLIDPARTFDTVTNSPVGGLNYTFSKYRIEITQQPIFSEGVDPATNYPVQAVADRGTAYSIADYNLENLYDFRDNPFSGCDFAGDSGCAQVTPFLSAVTPPYDYVPASNAVYQARLNDISLQIIDDLHNPDILMVQEVENQDFCKLDNGAMVCGAGNNDGKPDVLQDLALKIVANGGPDYDSAYDSDSSDLRGILPAFLYRTDRVQLVSPVGNPILSGSPTIGTYTAVPYDSDVSNPKTFNAVYTGTGACETDWVFPRAPGVALFRISSTNSGGGFQDVYLINNHFKSGPDTCVAHRTEQAKYNAALVAYIQAYNPVARIVVGGDLNVYPKPDNTKIDATNQLASLYNTSLSLTNLWDVINENAPASAYSYVFLGMAQTLDQMFINTPMMADLQDFRIAHINSDFPADYPAPGDIARGTSDHDPNVATFGINFNGYFQPIANTPTFNSASAGNAIPVKFSLFGYEGLNIFAKGYPLSKQIACDAGDDENTISETVTPGKNSLSYDALTDLYTYIWKTDKRWAGTCRMLVVELKDGTGQIAFFDFK